MPTPTHLPFTPTHPTQPTHSAHPRAHLDITAPYRRMCLWAYQTPDTERNSNVPVAARALVSLHDGVHSAAFDWSPRRSGRYCGRGGDG